MRPQTGHRFCSITNIELVRAPEVPCRTVGECSLRAEWAPMNWDRVKSLWGVVMRRRQRRRGQNQADAAAAIAKEADEKRLAEWLAREHKADPIHK
jgi:hypothetical protein